MMRRASIFWLKSALSLALLLAPWPGRAASKKLGDQAQTPSNTIPINATSTVNSCITVEAVLLPRKPAATMFGGYVADSYAVVKTTLSNRCPDQQFILHDIYFDYREWALSGVYADLNQSPTQCGTPGKKTEATPSGGAQGATPSGQPGPADSSVSTEGSIADTPTQANTAPCSLSDTNTTGSRAGQVATVGALDIQDQLTEDSVFSRRNLVVNGLTLVGAVAGGYAFVGSMAAAQGIGAFNSVFIPGLSKFWPDRSLDQEKFLLSLGYRTDQTTAIAKQGHGSYYVFFPLSTFLTPDLKKLFLERPGSFFKSRRGMARTRRIRCTAAGTVFSQTERRTWGAYGRPSRNSLSAIPGNTVNPPQTRRGNTIVRVELPLYGDEMFHL